MKQVFPLGPVYNFRMCIGKCICIETLEPPLARFQCTFSVMGVTDEKIKVKGNDDVIQREIQREFSVFVHDRFPCRKSYRSGGYFVVFYIH